MEGPASEAHQPFRGGIGWDFEGILMTGVLGQVKNVISCRRTSILLIQILQDIDPFDLSLLVLIFVCAFGR
jgi:hypothetical protein